MKQFVLIPLIFSSISSFSQDALNNYLKIAAENNPALKSIFNQYLATLEQIPQAKSLPDPTIMFNLFTSSVETRVGAQKAGSSISQVFPWFGQLKSQENAVIQMAKAHYQTFEEMKNKLFFDVQTTYFDVYVLEAAIKMTEENIQLLKSVRALGNVRLASAKESAVNLLRVEMDLEEIQNQLLLLKDSRLPLQTKFRELLNIQTDVAIIIPDTLQMRTFDKEKSVLLETISTQNPKLMAFDHQLSMLDAEIDVAEKMGYPSFTLGLSHISVSERTDINIPDSGKDVFIFPQIGIRLPLYRSKYRSMVKEKQLLKTSVSLQKENQENEFETQLEKSWRDYSDAVRRVGLYQRLVALANQSQQILVAQYTTNRSDFEEILRMEKKRLCYNLALEKARADQNTFVAYINYLTGVNVLMNQ